MNQSSLLRALSAKILVKKTADLEPQIEIKFDFYNENPQTGTAGKFAGDVFPASASGKPILLASLGIQKRYTLDKYRMAASGAAKWLKLTRNELAFIDLDRLDQDNLSEIVSAICEGIWLGVYRFNKYKYKKVKAIEPTITLVTSNSISSIELVVLRSKIISESVYLARDISHEPGNIINPETLAKVIARAGKEFGFEVTILEEKELKKMNANAIVAVGKASPTPSRMIILKYEGKKKTENPIVLVGKAITFDTGGYSLKAVDAIAGMKTDKCGGVNVLATLIAAARLKIKTSVVGVIGAAENMISGEAYRPDDIIQTMSGKTVEIITTDAEGRLVLADCLTYTQLHFNPRAIIDLATLTGGVVVALGHFRAGLFSNDDTLASDLSQHGEKVHEPLWRMPLDYAYMVNMKGDVADIKNSGGRMGHCIYGGLFLQQFINEGTPWAHLDIAGTGVAPKDTAYCQKGPTGFGIRLLVDYLESQ